MDDQPREEAGGRGGARAAATNKARSLGDGRWSWPAWYGFTGFWGRRESWRSHSVSFNVQAPLRRGPERLSDLPKVILMSRALMRLQVSQLTG